MGLVFLIVLGAIFGWLAAIILDCETQSGLARNMVSGVGGAMTAGLIVSPATGGGSLLSDNYSVAVLMLSLVGSLAAIAAANLYQHRHSH